MRRAALTRVAATLAVVAGAGAWGQTTAPSGSYFALIVGNEHYPSRPLKTPINDARSVDTLLRERFGFQTTLLPDATRKQIMAALAQYRKTLTPGSSLLIYYAGHGETDPEADNKAYWWPIGAEPDNKADWISADDIVTAVKTLPATHVLIVSDGCFSGALIRAGGRTENFSAGTARSRVLTKLSQRSSRELLASGGNEPVADGGAINHSIFADSFTAALLRVEADDFAVEEVSKDIRESVGGRSSQLPELDPIRNSGHDGGSFVFHRHDMVVGRLVLREGREMAPALPSSTEPVRISSGTSSPGLKTENIDGTKTVSPPPSRPPATGTLRTGKDGLQYVWINGGTFTMGCSRLADGSDDPECSAQEKPAHSVTTSKGFWMGQTPVTVAAWKRYAAVSKTEVPKTDDFGIANLNGADNAPVVAVKWDEAQAYCGWAGGLRLPTEAQWEYAARAGTTGTRYGELENIAMRSASMGLGQVPSKDPNAWQLYNMLGSVWQWLPDRYEEKYYTAAAATDPPGPAIGEFRVLRGGSWGSSSQLLRVSHRRRFLPNSRNNEFGLRCVGE
jgi:formylglycine-generating enzyme required for sulfatase activity